MKKRRAYIPERIENDEERREGEERSARKNELKAKKRGGI